MKKWITCTLLLLGSSGWLLLQAGEMHSALAGTLQTGSIVRDTCPGNYTVGKLNDFSFKADRRSSLKTITARIEGNMQLPNGYHADITAQKEIHFLPGFSTAPGSTLHAWIDPAPCNGITADKGTAPVSAATTALITRPMVYPNPSNGQFIIAVPAAMALGTYDILIQTIDGRTVEDLPSQTGSRTSINLQRAEKGMYLVRLLHKATGLADNFKVVIQ